MFDTKASASHYIGARPLSAADMLLPFPFPRSLTLLTAMVAASTIRISCGAEWKDALALSAPHEVQTELLDPRTYPGDARRWVKPPDWSVFGNETHFTALRYLPMKNRQLEGYSADFERYTKTFDLGDVIWPNCVLLTAANLPDVVAEMRRRNLFLFDIWGYVPGSGPGKAWPQFRLSPETSSLFSDQLGDHWLGMDMGEQDGRYVLGFAANRTDISDDHLAQYLNFHRYMERIGDDSGNLMAGLAAITFPHYLAKEGIFTLLGAETAQEHPNAQVFYAFIRGAGKEYGVPWFGNASIYNRWGWKTYEDRKGGKDQDHSGPTKGTSLALMKRLLYSHILYNSMIVGFEGGWLKKDTLTPIGKIQQSAQRWLRANGQPGVMQTPIGVLLDFDAGWIFPSYNSVLYRVWGNIPYGPGDYLTNNVFGMIYPGYQDSSFFHDETGFLTPTPYGDAADALLSDAPNSVLDRYPLLVVAGDLAGGAEIRNKLQAYVEQGGQLYITAGSLQNLPGGVAGISATGSALAFHAGQEVAFTGDRTVTESHPFELLPLHLPPGAQILASAGSVPAAVAATAGKGRAVVLASPFGISTESSLNGPVERPVDSTLPNPYPMLVHVQRILDAALREQSLFEVGDQLSLITCRRGKGDYLLGIGNNALAPHPFQIVSHIGAIQAVSEIPLDESEKSAVGYLPEGFERAGIGTSDAHTIAGGDFRIFHVTVAEGDVVAAGSSGFSIAPRGRYLALGNPVNIEDALLARPTFFQHFDGITLDWKYVADRDRAALEREAPWLIRQKVRIIVDLSSGVDLFPGFRLLDNYDVEYKRSMSGIADVISKMPSLGAHDLILTLHTGAGYFSKEEHWKRFAITLKDLCRQAHDMGVTLYLRNATGKLGTLDELLGLIDRVGASNLKLAVATGPLLASGQLPPAPNAKLVDKIGMWLVSTPRKDIAGRVWTTDAPLAGSDDRKKVEDWVVLALTAPIVADAVYPTQDDEYREAMAIMQLPRR